jgi:hypothetical protein
MDLDQWNILYRHTYHAFEVAGPHPAIQCQLSLILDQLIEIKPQPASQGADSLNFLNTPTNTMPTTCEPSLVTADPNQPLSVLYCEALVFTLGALTNDQLAQLYDDVKLKSDVLLDTTSAEMLQLSQALQLLGGKIQAIAERRYNLNKDCPQLTHILSN